MSVNVNTKQYGTKTEYNHSFWASSNVNKICSDENYELCIQNFVDTIDISSAENHLPNCQVKHLSGVLRHGSRFPSRNTVNEVKKFWQKIETNMPNYINESSKFKAFLLDSHDSSLAVNGKLEHYYIGKRIAKMFKNFLISTSSESVAFLSTSKSRAIESGQSFQQGLDDILSSTIFSQTNITVRNDLLKFYEFCLKFIMLADSDALKEEINNFYNSGMFNDLKEKMHKKLNLSKGIVLDAGIK